MMLKIPREVTNVLHQLLRWDDLTEKQLEQIEDTPPSEASRLIVQWRHQNFSSPRIYLLLALASSRWVDHRGPYIGHGTFNGGPMLRASNYLSAEYRSLALLHMTVYVLDLLRHPNYGPYCMQESFELTETMEQLQTGFIPDVESGSKALLSEHRAAHLAKSLGRDARGLMLEAALRQYPENEHRLLIVQRALQFLDDINAWSYAEAFFRPAVQYLANRPDARLANQVMQDWAALSYPELAKNVEHSVCRDLIENLIECEYGEEPEIIGASINAYVNGNTLREAMSMASSALMLRSGFDAHAVTGIHCVMDLLRDEKCPASIRGLTWLLALSGSRTRRQKAQRAQWSQVASARVGSSAVTFERLRQIIHEDGSGLDAAVATKQILQSGGDPTSVARELMQTSLATSDPFTAIHNVKMLGGLLKETLHSQWPEQAWIHLSAGARVVAMSVERSQAMQDVLRQWLVLHPESRFFPH